MKRRSALSLMLAALAPTPAAFDGPLMNRLKAFRHEVGATGEVRGS